MDRNPTQCEEINRGAPHTHEIPLEDYPVVFYGTPYTTLFVSYDRRGSEIICSEVNKN